MELVSCETCKHFVDPDKCYLETRYKIDAFSKCINGVMRVEGDRKPGKESYTYSLWKSNKEDFLTEDDILII